MNQMTSNLRPLAHPQRGAMFGLDARIALAIFGLLSVVAGYTALNYFSDARVTALATELKNMQNAYSEFVIATGDHPARFMDLINNESGYSGWNGPYISGMLNDKSRLYGTYSIMEGRIDVNGVPPIACEGGGICGAWLKLTDVADAVAKDSHARLNKGENNLSAGILRVELKPGGTDDVYYLLQAKGATMGASGSGSAE
ncbi:MAG: hypothetical protein INF43_01330 [Alphaproteobacteria bacterium]|nr:hypothetical protein [Alphaproteobacteria bacterium]